MSTWNSITIDSPPADLTLESLFEKWPALHSDGQIWEGREEDDERVSYPARRGDWQDRGTPRENWAYSGREGNPEGGITIQGRSKYLADEAEAALYELSAAYPDITITFWQEWDEGDPGSSADVIRAGVLVPAESAVSRLTPRNLPELIAALRAALDNGTLEVRESGKPMVRPIHVAALALVDALDPQTPKEK